MTAKEREEKTRKVWARMKELPEEVMDKFAFSVELMELITRHSTGPPDGKQDSA